MKRKKRHPVVKRVEPYHLGPSEKLQTKIVDQEDSAPRSKQTYSRPGTSIYVDRKGPGGFLE
jgi:hypothetical protein